jgi:Flp pilus assembly protein TadG
MRGRRRHADGASAVEFALVLPLLLLLVFGIIQYGFYFWSLQGGSAAVRDAARFASVGKPTSCADFRLQVQGNLSSVGARNVAITRDFSSDSVQRGDTVTVRVEFDSVDLNLPFVPLPGGGQVVQEALARVENVPDAAIGDCS